MKKIEKILKLKLKERFYIGNRCSSGESDSILGWGELWAPTTPQLKVQNVCLVPLLKGSINIYLFRKKTIQGASIINTQSNLISYHKMTINQEWLEKPVYFHWKWLKRKNIHVVMELDWIENWKLVLLPMTNQKSVSLSS